ncbi:hypothetical protein VKT23_011086 [Stygiomarasmius scandens]|uniref:Uncharacterized protein n=1 Tax=Marasmiellus scandens TaxID=2682957 RepID=A0ABR1JCG0_9AGAR
MELQRFYTGHVSSAIPPHRYPQVYNLRIGGKRRRRRSSSSESGRGRQTGKPSKSSPLAQAHAVSFLELNLGLEDDESDSDTEKDSMAVLVGRQESEYDCVPLTNPWPESSEKSGSQFSYERNTYLPEPQTEPRGQVSVSYLPFQSCSDLTSTLEPHEPSTPPGLGAAAQTILQLCDQLEYIANSMLPQSTAPKPQPESSDSMSLAESLMDEAFPSSGMLFDGSPFAELPPVMDTSDSSTLVSV